MITLTKAEALHIQAEHIAHYGTYYGAERVRAIVKAATRPELLPDSGKIDVVEVNRAIPRGGAIESLLIAAGLMRDPGYMD
jgi:hypothetical protein